MMPLFLSGDLFEPWTAASGVTICPEIICDVSHLRDPMDGHNTSAPEWGLKMLALRLLET